MEIVQARWEYKMSGIICHQEFNSFSSSTLSYNNPVRSHSKGRTHQVSNSYFQFSLKILLPSLQPYQVLHSNELQFCRIFNSDYSALKYLLHFYCTILSLKFLLTRINTAFFLHYIFTKIAQKRHPFSECHLHFFAYFCFILLTLVY